MKTFDEWWREQLEEDPELLEDFPQGFEGMEQIARFAWYACKNEIVKDTQPTQFNVQY